MEIPVNTYHESNIVILSRYMRFIIRDKAMYTDRHMWGPTTPESRIV